MVIKIKSALHILLFAFIIAMLTAYGFLFTMQRYLIFTGYTRNLVGEHVKSPSGYGLNDYSEIPLKTSDSLNIFGWSHDSQGDKPVIVYFHGTGGTLPGRIGRYRAFAKEGFGLFVLSYRGYGNSEAPPPKKAYTEMYAQESNGLKSITITHELYRMASHSEPA